MNSQCYRCKRFTHHPIIVEFKDEACVVRWRVTLCLGCEAEVIKEVEEFPHD